MNNTAIHLTINGKAVETVAGRSLLEAALSAGIYIPHLCHHPDLRPTGTCGICVVEVQGAPAPMPSCTTPAADGMVVTTQSDPIIHLRRQAMNRMLVDHPEECVDCSQYLNCELQSVRQFIGTDEEVNIQRSHVFIPVNRANPLFVHDFKRCIRCGRCVRACNELRGAGVLQFIGEGENPRVGVPDGKGLIEAGCRFCGACVQVCPTGALRDKEELLEGKKRREALVPCAYTCPAQIDVPRYVRLVRANRCAEAVAVIREKVPFPKILGYVCNHPCESVCRRGAVNEPISIRDLKRFAAENDAERLWESNQRKNSDSGKRVAVVGAGPAGLTAAWYLSKQGHAVTVFEAMPQPGGMLRYGIPAYRLPRDILDEEIEEITRMGVEIRTDTPIDAPEALIDDQAFDAVLLAIGTHQGMTLPIAGADLPAVRDGLAFLREVNLGQGVAIGREIVVLGGGNVAFDCARVARRLGAAKVTIACLENKNDMPAACDEIEEGEEEGIQVLPMRTFTRIVAADDRVAGVECLQVASFEFDDEGRAQIEAVEDSAHVLPADMVIFAIGQRPRIPEDFDVELTERGRIEVDDYSLETSLSGVFAIGDAVLGSSTVIQAIAQGRKGAVAVDHYLGGDGNIDEVLAPVEPPETWLGPDARFARLDRCAKYCIGVAERLAGFCTLVQPLDEAEALAEAGRCLRCDLRLKSTPVKFWGDY